MDLNPKNIGFLWFSFGCPYGFLLNIPSHHVVRSLAPNKLYIHPGHWKTMFCCFSDHVLDL